MGYLILGLIVGFFAGVIVISIFHASNMKRMEGRLKKAWDDARFYEQKWGEVVETVGRRIAQKESPPDDGKQG